MWRLGCSTNIYTCPTRPLTMYLVWIEWRLAHCGPLWPWTRHSRKPFGLPWICRSHTAIKSYAPQHATHSFFLLLYLKVWTQALGNTHATWTISIFSVSRPATYRKQDISGRDCWDEHSGDWTIKNNSDAMMESTRGDACRVMSPRIVTEFRIGAFNCAI